MTATFGKLQNATLTLQPGLNCIYAPNESGKSTWTRFLLNMCYGLNTRDRNPYSDKLHYQPWSGGAMQGAMDLIHQGRPYTLTRTTRRPNAPMGEFLLTYGGTGDSVPGLTAADAGEWLLGVPREVYERSGFISQSDLAVRQDAELEKRIAALITTGEEDISYTRTMKILRDQRNRRKHNRTGLIPALEAQCRALEQELSDAAHAEELLHRTEEALHLARQERDTLRDYAARWDTIAARQEAAVMAQRHAGIESRLPILHRRALDSDAACAAHPLHGVSPEELDKQLHPAPPKKPLSRWIPAGAMLFCGLFLFGGAPQVMIPFGIAMTVFAFAALYLTFRYRQYIDALADQQRTIDALQDQITKYERLKETALRSREDWLQYKELCDTLPPTPPVSPEQITPPPIPQQEVTHRLRQIDADILRHRTQLDTTAGRLAAMGNSAEKRSLLQQKRRQIETHLREHDALTMAMESLDQANQIIQSRFSPALGARAARIFSELTGGRYDKVTLSRTFDLSAATAEDAALRALPLLSRGAADQLYLAVRLAICEMVLPGAPGAPLVLDDALVSFDDQRMAAALDVLLHMAQSRQVILFTCQRREADYLRGRDNVHLIQL